MLPKRMLSAPLTSKESTVPNNATSHRVTRREPNRPLGADTVILGVETSCDETAAAVVVGGSEVRSSVVSSQIDLHARFGGVVPEIASRAHAELVVPVITEALGEAGMTGADVDVVAATYGPGLIGALLVGVSAAKAYATVWDVPFVAVNHLEAHLYASLLESPALEFPAVVLLVSGGHTILVSVEAPTRYTVLGQTLDDAAGEAFDKVARFLGLGYPGGPVIDRIAKAGDPTAVAFPRAMRDGSFDFSFSGLKTSVVNYVRKHPDVTTEDIAASFQAAVVDVLVNKTLAAARQLHARSICLGGGVAANSALRTRIADVGESEGFGVYLPSLAFCTDNAAMIASAAWHRIKVDGPSDLHTGAVPSLAL